MHVMAKGFSAAGYDAYALDIRGHGDSSTRGHIAYVGQLEDDMEDFVHAVKLAQPSTLIGFSSGGGFVLRFAGFSKEKLFSNYLLLAPFISQDAATSRPDSGGWVSVGVPRIIAISFLNGFGVHAFDDLPVIRYALTKENAKFLTPGYRSPWPKTLGRSGTIRQTSVLSGNRSACWSARMMKCSWPTSSRAFSREQGKIFPSRSFPASATSH